MFVLLLFQKLRKIVHVADQQFLLSMRLTRRVQNVHYILSKDLNILTVKVLSVNRSFLSILTSFDSEKDIQLNKETDIALTFFRSSKI